MDLDIIGRRALVNAASKGLGKACATALAREGVAVVMTGRDPASLEAAATEIRAETGANVETVAADIATEAGRQSVLQKCPNPDILINNCGGPPPGDFRDWSRDDWIRALDANMLSAIAFIKATIDPMIANGFGRIINITSVTVKAPIDVLGLSNGARAGLTGFVGGLSRQVARHNVTINNILPGPFGTDRVLAPAAAQAASSGQTLDQVMDSTVRGIPAHRLGRPAELGSLCAFLCSSHAGFIVGQNILIDGGSANLTF